MKIETTTAYPIRVENTLNSRLHEVDFDNLTFGRNFTDHQFVMDYRDGEWTDLRIEPFQNMSIHPATSGIHYGQSIFEGMKAYKSADGSAHLHRPKQNIARFNKSAWRMAMPNVPEEIFEQALQKLMHMDKGWIPDRPGCSLYIRPFMFATEEFIGIKIADNYRFMIIASPAGMYYPKPVKVIVADEYVRACKGGTGYAKAAGNYGAAMHPLRQAQEQGYDQVLWMDGENFSEIHEIGTMNVFFVTKDKVVTPSTEQGTILEGVTRDSVIQLLRHRGVEVSEDVVTIDEVVEAYESGNLLEIFGTGTAATIAQIEKLGYKGRDLVFDQKNWELSDWIK
ncbi:MAG: branched-chain amino acid aminotransferase, partial [Limisphaerales bacterium]